MYFCWHCTSLSYVSTFWRKKSDIFLEWYFSDSISLLPYISLNFVFNNRPRFRERYSPSHTSLKVYHSQFQNEIIEYFYWTASVHNFSLIQQTTREINQNIVWSAENTSTRDEDNMIVSDCFESNIRVGIFLITKNLKSWEFCSFFIFGVRLFLPKARAPRQFFFKDSFFFGVDLFRSELVT